jgi:hypothetical protein
MFGYCDVLPDATVEPLRQLWAEVGLDVLYWNDVSEQVVEAAGQRGGSASAAEALVIDALAAGDCRYVTVAARAVDAPTVTASTREARAAAMRAWDEFVVATLELAIAEIGPVRTGVSG